MRILKPEEVRLVRPNAVPAEEHEQVHINSAVSKPAHQEHLLGVLKNMISTYPSSSIIKRVFNVKCQSIGTLWVVYLILLAPDESFN